LRGDDGAGQRVLEILGACDGVSARSVAQLVPELAAEIAGADSVLFIDADVTCLEPQIEPIARIAGRPTALTHTMTVSEVVGLAERLYGFAGVAFLCRVPARAFESAETLSPVAEAGALSAAEMVSKLLLWPQRADRVGPAARQAGR
jgi:Ni,Fe-hydrogenase maturation factor